MTSSVLAQLQNIAPFVSAGIVLVVGITAATIAHRQAVTARTKLQLDLYDKRRPIYVTARNLIFCVDETDANVLHHVLKSFQESRIDTPFLFDRKVADWMETLIAAAGDRLELEAEAFDDLTADEANPRPSRNLISKEQWREGWLQQLDKVFAPYLKLEARRSHVRGR